MIEAVVIVLGRQCLLGSAELLLIATAESLIRTFDEAVFRLVAELASGSCLVAAHLARFGNRDKDGSVASEIQAFLGGCTLFGHRIVNELRSKAAILTKIGPLLLDYLLCQLSPLSFCCVCAQGGTNLIKRVLLHFDF